MYNKNFLTPNFALQVIDLIKSFEFSQSPTKSIFDQPQDSIHTLLHFSRDKLSEALLASSAEKRERKTRTVQHLLEDS